MAEVVTIARPYAEAVYRLAGETGTLARWSDTLAAAAAVAENPDFAAAAGNPNLGAAKVAELLLAVCAQRLDAAGANLVRLLADNKRLTVLPAIRDQFEALKTAAEGELEAVIRSAFPLDAAQRDALTARLAARYGKRVRVVETVDPELIGGVVISVGDQNFDASVKGRLAAMAVALKT